jgi:hypothetical protein
MRRARRRSLRLIALSLVPALIDPFTLPKPIQALSTNQGSLLSSIQPVSYYIYNNNGIFNAINGQTGATDFASSDAATVIQSAINALPKGGIIHLTGNTTFTLSSPVTFSGGLGDDYNQEWILEGEGASSIISQANTGMDALVINNQTKVHFHDFKVLTAAKAGHGLFGSNTGTSSEISAQLSRFRNLVFEGLGPTGTYDSVIHMINSFENEWTGLEIHSAASEAAVILENNSQTINYGNSTFNQIYIESLTADGIHITGTTGQTTHHTLNAFMGLYVEGNNVSGSHGLYLGGGAYRSTFLLSDIEDFDYAIYMNGTSTNKVLGNRFYGGYLQSTTASIVTGNYGSGNSFRDINLSNNVVGGTPTHIKDSNISLPANQYENLSYAGTGTISLTGTILPMFSGPGGNNQFFSNYGTSTQNGNGSNSTFNIAHKLVKIPRYFGAVNGAVGMPQISYVSANATNLIVNFLTPPPAGTNNVVLLWEANM